MTTKVAFWRLFPPSLFTLLGVIMSVIWQPDPVLMVISMCSAAACAAWLVITVVAVAKTLHVEMPSLTQPRRV